MKTIFGILTAISYILLLLVVSLHDTGALGFGKALFLAALCFGAVFGSLYVIERVEEAER